MNRMAAIDDMRALKNKIIQCKRCSLYTTVKNKVIGKGSLEPDIVLVGEAPGQAEDETGIPFVGASGKLLDRIITEAGIKNYAIINSLKCRPPENRNPLPEELEPCKSWFEEQLSILKPKRIIALGKIALSQLGLPDSTIISRIGTIEKSEYGDVLILPHPSYLLRNQSYQLPYEKIRAFIGNQTLKTADEKILLQDYTINKQQADNLGKFEMISSELAGLHYFCKLANVPFVDINQKDLCKINGKVARIINIDSIGHLGDIDNIIEVLISYSIENNNIIWHEWWNTIPGSEVKMVSSLLPIYIDPISEKKIELQPFVHLHVHSEYSIKDGYGSMEQIAESLHKKGFSACALTDHGTMAGTIYFQKALLEKDIKPILGCEIYLIPEETKEAQRYHLTILCKNKVGWDNLLKLQEIANTVNYYYKPRISLRNLFENKEGLVILSGCMSGIIPKNILEGNYTAAEELIEIFNKGFGDDFYIELQPNRIPEQRTINEFLIGMIKKYSLKFVITTDSHYPDKEQERFHKAVKAISWRKTYEESGFSDDTFYLQTKDDMIALLREYHPVITEKMIEQAFRYSMEIKDKCNFKIEPIIGDSLPKLYDNPKEKLKGLVIEGLKKYTPYSYDNPNIKERIDLEIDRITRKNYENYFLVVHDYVQWCKNNGIMVGPGRGSCGGSLAAFALNITETDPLRFDLLFDRFISEIRKDAPDIDLDFEDTKRNRLIQYFKDKYGERNVAKIITYSTWHAKGVLRDVGRIFKIPIPEINKLCNVVIERSDGDVRADSCLVDTFAEFEQAKDFYKKYQFACDIAIGLESHIKFRGIHAAGIILAEDSISERIPTEKIKGDMVVVWEKKEVENIGLIKFDILGLKTLNVISETLEKIRQRHNISVSLPNTFEDPLIYEKIFKQGKTLGIFQLETSGLARLSKQLQTDSFKLLYDSIALFRPGALNSGQTSNYVLKHNKEIEWIYGHLLLEPITKDTYGEIIYQEQVMRIIVELGGFSWATAESARKIMGKSQGRDAFNKLRKEFCENALKKHGLAVEESGKIFDAVSTHGEYSFNKSHAVEYSIISYWTAWLKVYYPSEFFAALMSRESDAVRVADYIREAKQFAGLKVKTPDMNVSGIGFKFDSDGNIVVGFDNIKKIAEKTAAKLITAQPYDNLQDFVLRSQCTLSIFKALICCGVFDSVYKNRKYLYDNSESIIKPKKKKSFLLSSPEDTEDWDDIVKEEMLMKYLELPTDTPLIDKYDNPFADKLKFNPIGNLEFLEPVEEIWVKGIVTSIVFKQENLGDWTPFENMLEKRYAHMNINDGTGNVFIHLPPEQYTYYKRYLERKTGFPVIIKGHSIKNLSKLYCDAMIVLDDIDYKNPIISYIDGKINEIKKEIQEKYPQYKVGMLKSVAYKISKNRNPYARLNIDDESNKFIMCFKLSFDIFIAGEIIVYELKEPFLNIIERIK